MKTNNELYAAVCKLKPDDVILVHARWRALSDLQQPREKTFSIRVSRVTDETAERGFPCVSLGYESCRRPDTLVLGHGCAFFRPELPDTVRSEWGWQSFEVVGTEKTYSPAHWQPKPGDKGYDLMH